MPARTESLDIYAQALGYVDEKAMLVDLYLNQKMSTATISRILQCRSKDNIRARMLRFGIKLRRPGGYMGRRGRDVDTLPSDPKTDNGMEQDPLLPTQPPL